MKNAVCQIRWLIRQDMAEVLDIERSSFEFAWTEEDFFCCLRQRNCIGLVAEVAGEVVGFVIYELHRGSLRILNFAVNPSARRQGIGSKMVRRLVDKLSQQRRNENVLDVREGNLAAQLFFRSQGFKAVGVLKHWYEDTEEDAYCLRYGLGEDGFSPLYSPANRIKGMLR